MILLRSLIAFSCLYSLYILVVIVLNLNNISPLRRTLYFLLSLLKNLNLIIIDILREKILKSEVLECLYLKKWSLAFKYLMLT